MDTHPHIDVAGAASIDVEPDCAVLTAELKHVADLASDGKHQVDLQSSAVIELAKNCGVSQNDLAASQLTIGPEHDWQSERNEYKGTAVSRDVTITLRDLTYLGKLLQGLADVPVFRLSRLALDSSDRKKHEKAALANAIGDAKRTAQDIADGLDLKITGVLRVSQERGRYESTSFHSADLGLGVADFEIGLIKISAEVYIVFNIEPR